jgi:hypothetical protein
MAAHAAALAEQDLCPSLIVQPTSPLTSTMSAAWQVWQPLRRSASETAATANARSSVRLLDAGSGAAIALVAGRTAELVRIMSLQQLGSGWLVKARAYSSGFFPFGVIAAASA